MGPNLVKSGIFGIVKSRIKPTLLTKVCLVKAIDFPVVSITDLMDMSLSKLWELVMDRGGLACCSPWGWKESDTTEWLNNIGLSVLEQQVQAIATRQ